MPWCKTCKKEWSKTNQGNRCDRRVMGGTCGGEKTDTNPNLPSTPSESKREPDVATAGSGSAVIQSIWKASIESAQKASPTTSVPTTSVPTTSVPTTSVPTMPKVQSPTVKQQPKPVQEPSKTTPRPLSEPVQPQPQVQAEPQVQITP